MEAMRKWVGWAFLILGFVAPLFSPIGFWLGMPPTHATILAGLLLLGLPELFWLIAALLIGKDAVRAVKSKVLSFGRKSKNKTQ